MYRIGKGNLAEQGWLASKRRSAQLWQSRVSELNDDDPGRVPTPGCACVLGF
jgi:hypothetical protein